VWQAVFHPHEDVVRSRVVPFLLENPINLLPLACHSETRNFIRDFDFGWVFWGFTDHGDSKLASIRPISRTIPIIIPWLFRFPNHHGRTCFRMGLVPGISL
jgi:hypothetical protein